MRTPRHGRGHRPKVTAVATRGTGIPNMKERDKKIPTNKTWLLWKSTFLEVHEGLQHQIQYCGGDYQFGSTNTITETAKPSTSKPPRSTTIVTPNLLNKMFDYMDNITNSVTNEKDVMEKLVATKENQTTTISIQANTILSVEVKKMQLNITNRGGRGGKSDGVRKLLKDGYCCSHR